MVDLKFCILGYRFTITVKRWKRRFRGNGFVTAQGIEKFSVHRRNAVKLG